MTLEIAIVLGLLVLAMVLFATEWLTVDVVALGLVAALIGAGILSPSDAFEGFGSEIIIILASIMVLAGAIVKSGVMEWLGEAAYCVAKGRKFLAKLVLFAMS